MSGQRVNLKTILGDDWVMPNLCLFNNLNSGLSLIFTNHEYVSNQLKHCHEKHYPSNNHMKKALLTVPDFHFGTKREEWQRKSKEMIVQDSNGLDSVTRDGRLWLL